MREEPRILTVERIGEIEDIGKESARAMPAHCRYRYRQEVSYTLEDGGRTTGAITGLTKPKLNKAIDRRTENAESGSLFASIVEGKFRGTVLMMR